MRALLLAVLAVALASSGCGPMVDLSKGLQIVDVTSGWLDAGLKNGENKLVPSITFKVKNVSDQLLVALQLSAVFKVQGKADEWGSDYRIIAQSEGLAPGVTTQSWTMKSPQGYTSPTPRAEMLLRQDFVDAKVELTAKYASAQWVRVGDFPIERRLLLEQ
jgi:hypothetical protein